MSGYYGYHYPGPGPHAIVGARLVHTLELKQRYDSVNTGAVQSLLGALSRDGVISSAGSNRWEVALRDGAWVVLVWYPDHRALEVTVTDRELRDVDQMPRIQRTYEAILAKITPHLRTYGATTVGRAFYADAPAAPRAHVGQGSIIPHTPGEIEDELKQLNREMLAFGQEASEHMRPLEAQAKSRVQKLREEELAAGKTVESFQPLVKEVYRLEQLLNEAKIPSSLTSAWRNQPPPYDNIRRFPLPQRARGLRDQFVAAKDELDKFMPQAERRAAIQNQREATHRRSVAEGEQLREFPLVRWSQTVWSPFFAGWREFYSQKIDIPLQTLPGSGTWDRIQEYRRQFIELRNNAPFRAQGPTPLDPTSRTDPSVSRGLGSIWSGAGDVFGIVKWGLIGALGIGALVALGSVFSNVRKGRDPSERYLDLIQPRRARSPRALPAARDQRALPAGSDEDR